MEECYYIWDLWKQNKNQLKPSCGSKYLNNEGVCCTHSINIIIITILLNAVLSAPKAKFITKNEQIIYYIDYQFIILINNLSN